MSSADAVVHEIMAKYGALDPLEFERYLVRTLDREFRAAEENLRDKFAMGALSGLLSARGFRKSVPVGAATEAFRMADAMIAARQTPVLPSPVSA